MEDTFGIASQCSNVAYIYAMKGDRRAALKWFEASKTRFEISGNQKQADLALPNMETLQSVISSGE